MPPGPLYSQRGVAQSSSTLSVPSVFGQVTRRLDDASAFWDIHPLDLVVVPKEGCYSRCKQCGIQVNPLYPYHWYSKECQVGVEHHKQRVTAVSSALALRQQLAVCGNVLKRVEVYKYLGRLMAQDNNDIQAIWAQIQKARATWARVGQILQNKNASPFVAARFYQAIVQAILLYSSETWVIS
jgi:hypothetical protein